MSMYASVETAYAFMPHL